MLAAIRMGITTLVIPEDNRKDLEEIPKHILKKVRIVTATNIDEVLKVTLEKYPPSPPAPARNPAQKPKATARRAVLPPKVVS